MERESSPEEGELREEGELEADSGKATQRTDGQVHTALQDYASIAS